MKKLSNDLVQWVMEKHSDSLIPECQIEKNFCDVLDVVSGEIKIGGIEYNASDILKKINPAAYKAGLADHKASMLQIADGNYITKSDLKMLLGF